jgi:hypothetical protein
MLSGMSNSRAYRRRQPVLRGIVASVAALALLGHLLTGMPAMLRMAASASHSAVAIQGAGDCHHRHPGNAPPCDPDHCLLCQGGIGVFVLAGPPVWSTLPAEHATFGITAQVFAAVASPHAGYAPRAPPASI